MSTERSELLTSKSYEYLLPPPHVLKQKILEWIEEDIPAMDVGAAVVGDELVEATLFYKPSRFNSFCIIAGVPFLNVIFRECFLCEVDWKFEEGALVRIKAFTPKVEHEVNQKIKIPIAIVKGKACRVLQAERIALNLLSRCSAIATASHEYYQSKVQHKWHGEIAATRKTTPGFRLFEKYSVIVGGCSSHRFDVSSMCMLKDNHIDSCNGSIELCVQKAKALGGFSLMIEVECRNLEDAKRAAKAGAHVVMLDNMKPTELKQAAKELKSVYPNVIVEASGGLTLETIHDYFDENVDVISTSAILYGMGSVHTQDFSLKLDVNK